MTAYAERRRAFTILDLPANVSTIGEARNWINGTPKSANAAAYYPKILVADPASGNVRPFGNSGAIAGVYARTDGQRGVWKAPAGTEATILGAAGLEQSITDAESGLINAQGLNALRRFPHGTVVWGARTLLGSDALASDWKYVPVRRTALFLEESLMRGLAWTAFGPNDESLWSKVRLSAGAFMNKLFRAGAFTGASPKNAYFVKCDGETNTASDINNGLANLVVGFAPLKPAEFVVIKIVFAAQQPG
jgi:phage tail sheath protein FI